VKTHRLPDGRALAFRETGSGRPLVLLHGWAMSSAVFAEALEYFAREFRVLAPDLRGHGCSDPAPGYAFSDFARDLAHWMAALGLEQAALVGWSLGGQVLMKLFPEVRDRVARAILIDTTPRFTAGPDWSEGLPEGQVRAMARDLKRNYLKTMQDFFALQFAGEAISRERYKQIVSFAVRSGRLPEPEVALSALETLRRGDLRQSLSVLDCPALVLHGGLDRVTLPGAGKFLAGQLPQGKLEMLQGGGHAPFLSRPEEVFRMWREFLE
jgi:pimeloyl-[acyl-carrier protein] methyl ester esterase